jgi:hypothetical protein
MAGDAEEVQRQRARQAWELVVLETPDDRGFEALRRLLRVKRFERERLAAQVPGVVRRGARVDLVELEASLRAAGIRCELRPNPAAA